MHELRLILMVTTSLMFGVPIVPQLRDARAQESPGDRYAIALESAHIIVFKSDENLQRACRSRHRVRACTIFREELICSCEALEKGWFLTARAQLAPIMFLSKPELIIHEQLHIEDLKVTLARHLKRLVSARFVSRMECEQAGKAASDPAAFHRLMNDFRKDSNRRLK